MPRNELSDTEYLATLNEIDRTHVAEFLTIIRAIQEQQLDSRLGILAVGSSVMPLVRRNHPVNDIDLRVLWSEPKEGSRTSLVSSIVASLTEQLTSRETEFVQIDYTVSRRLIRGSHKTLKSWIDYSNNDPSFFIRNSEGLPLHISVSGIERLNLQSHLEQETLHNAYFSQLV